MKKKEPAKAHESLAALNYEELLAYTAEGHERAMKLYITTLHALEAAKRDLPKEEVHKEWVKQTDAVMDMAAWVLSRDDLDVRKPRQAVSEFHLRMRKEAIGPAIQAVEQALADMKRRL